MKIIKLYLVLFYIFFCNATFANQSPTQLFGIKLFDPYINYVSQPFDIGWSFKLFSGNGYTQFFLDKNKVREPNSDFTNYEIIKGEEEIISVGGSILFPDIDYSTVDVNFCLNKRNALEKAIMTMYSFDFGFIKYYFAKHDEKIRLIDEVLFIPEKIENRDVYYLLSCNYLKDSSYLEVKLISSIAYEDILKFYSYKQLESLDFDILNNDLSGL